jgi:hypothetical protein
MILDLPFCTFKSFISHLVLQRELTPINFRILQENALSVSL